MSKSYKVDVSGVGKDDELRLVIRHEAVVRELLVLLFRGDELAGKRSIHFYASHEDEKWRLSFSGAKPFAVVTG